MSERATRGIAITALWLGVCLSIFQLWQPIAGFFPPGALPFEHILGLQGATYFRPTHLGWILVLGYLLYPVARDGSWTRLFDG
ncbi:MAG: hypothetical protein AAF513_17820, partial [Pseudomonadota bacterium]